jgi:subtilisin family serine protease
MNLNQKRIYTTLSTAMLAIAAGSAFSMGSEKSGSSIHQQITLIAARSLDLQPGDEQLLDHQPLTPIDFVEIPNERTFTGQLLVHARKGKVRTASARVSPLTVKSSAFVNEYVINVPKGLSEGELAAVLLATGDYEFVEPNWLRYPAIIPNDPQYGSSWQHTRLQSAAAWDLNTGSSDIIVAVCDSGVDLDHPDLVASLIPGYNSASNQTQASGGNVNDINGHGTFVSGCAAAKGNNNIGVTGVGWDFSLMPVRVTNNSNGTASSFNILEGARWAADNGAHVVNASFSGGTSGSNNTTAAYLKTQGSLLFWASGNDGSFISPNLPDIIIVGSTTSGDIRSGFSNFGPAVDITAPGSSVRSTRNGGTFGNGSGTSYASPIAAGVGAMIYAVNPDFDGDDVQFILYNSVDDLGAPGRDDSFGRGRVNTRKAIELAQTYIRPTSTPINESFESNTWQDLFVATSGSAETATTPQAPDGSSVLLLDGADAIETVPLAGRSLDDDAVLSFMLKATSIEPGESLDVEYLVNPETSPDTWASLASINGQGLASSEFVAYDIVLPSEYEWHGVKIRFVANGSDSSDEWMIDSLAINSIQASVAPFVDHFESGMISQTRWGTVQGASTSFNDDNFSVQMSDSDRIVSRDIPLDQLGFVQSYIRFDAWVDDQVSPTDGLLIEVFNSIDEWETVTTINANDLTNAAQLIELNVPLTAIVIPDMRIRYTATTSGAFHIDNIYIGDEELVGGCSDADLAEPFGELNFFDVSAFLAAFSSSDPAADLNDDGLFNFFDISAFLSVFNAGCP